MKKLFLLLAASLIILPVFSQDQELSAKERRKLERKTKQEEEAQAVRLMIENQGFVLEAAIIENHRGTVSQISPELNYLVCDSQTGIIQIGQKIYVGINGEGGITIKGPVGKYDYSYSEKKREYHVNYTIRSSTDTYDIQLTCSPKGKVEATVNSSWPGQLIYSGFLVPPGESRVYSPGD